MIKDKTRFTSNRRIFLKGAAAAGGAAALSAVSAGVMDEEPETENATAAAQDTEAGYHETQHIRDYYRALRS